MTTTKKEADVDTITLSTYTIGVYRHLRTEF